MTRRALGRIGVAALTAAVASAPAWALTSSPEQPLSSTGRAVLDPAIAFDELNDRFVVAWEGFDGFTSRVATRPTLEDGQPVADVVDASTALPTGAPLRPSIAPLGPGSGYLLGWIAAGRAFVRMLDVEGRPGPDAADLGPASAVAVAADRSGRGLVVSATGSGLRVRVLSDAGRPGRPVAVGPKRDVGPPALAFDRSARAYVVAWSDRQSRRVRTARVTRAGAVRPGGAMPGTAGRPILAGRLVVWGPPRGTGRIVAQRIDSRARALGRPRTVATGTGDIAGARGPRGRTLVTWPNGTALRARLVSATGAPTGPIQTVGRGVADARPAAVGASTTRWLVGYVRAADGQLVVRLVR